MDDEIVLFIGGLVFSFLLGVLITTAIARSNMKPKTEIIEHGCAYYECNPKTGDTKFVWTQNVGPKPPSK